jgi:DNA-directed RNA polymerase alpha subunit
MRDAELRDHFAGIALAGLIAKIPLQELGIDDETVEYNNIASSAYLYANAMMEERSNEEIYLNDNASIQELKLTIRTANCLMSEDIFTIGELISLGVIDLLKIPNMGTKSLNDIKGSLKKHGLKLKGDK